MQYERMCAVPVIAKSIAGIKLGTGHVLFRAVAIFMMHMPMYAILAYNAISSSGIF